MAIPFAVIVVRNTVIARKLSIASVTVIIRLITGIVILNTIIIELIPIALTSVMLLALDL